MVLQTSGGHAAMSMGTRRRRLPAASAGVVGPLSFIGGWVAAGALRPEYSPVREAISQLARLGAPHRPLMTTAFVAFGVTVPVFAPVLADSLGAGKPLTASLSLAGLATLGVAAFPLSRAGGGAADLVHGTFATLGYVGMAISPMFGAAGLFRRGHVHAAVASGTVGLVSAAALAATAFAFDVGLFQRLGLGVVDAWLVVMAVSILRARDGEAFASS
jgi:hypothetical membrane protein